MLRSGNVFKMLRNGVVVNLDKKKYILLGINSYNDSDLESDLESIKGIRLFYPELKDRDTFLYMIVFFYSSFDFMPYDEFKSEKPIKNVFIVCKI